MGFLSWLSGSNDRQLAESTYSGRESASDRAARRRREGHKRNVTKTARKAQAREDKFWRNL
ncbi:hypothetical protein [Streptomyces sp. NPDC002547]